MTEVAKRTIPWDWYPGTIPDNVHLEPDAYLATTYSFNLYRSAAPVGVRMGRAASTYLGTMFDIGPAGSVSIGEFTLIHGARIVCDSSVEIGSHALISWNVVIMDTYRVPTDPLARRNALNQLHGKAQLPDGIAPARPVKLGNNVWLGFDVCIMPGVTIGDGSIIGARSIVFDNVPPYSIAAGNPARVIRTIEGGAP